MHFVRQPDAVPWRVRVVRYPAPLCERCNVPMAFNGEYAHDSKPAHYEYQCPVCGEGKMVRRTNYDREPAILSEL